MSRHRVVDHGHRLAASPVRCLDCATAQAAACPPSRSNPGPARFRFPASAASSTARPGPNATGCRHGTARSGRSPRARRREASRAATARSRRTPARAGAYSRRAADRPWRPAHDPRRRRCRIAFTCRSERTNRPAPTSSASDSDTCSTTSARRVRLRRSAPTARESLSAWPGSTCTARIAGRTPNSRPVSSDTPNANASSRASMRPADGGSGNCCIRPIAQYASDDTGGAAEQRQHRALGEMLPRHAPRSRPERQPDRELAAPRDRARQEQVRHVRAGNDEHERGDKRQPQRQVSCARAARRCRQHDGSRQYFRRGVELRVRGAQAQRFRRLPRRRLILSPGASRAT